MDTRDGDGAGAGLRPRDWLLLLFDGAERPLDRVRIQKSLFLFAERSKALGREKYDFVPYHYGPFSFAIYPDLDRLVAEGLLRLEVESTSTSPRYSLTATGVSGVEELRRAAPQERLTLLHSLRDWVTERSFRNLLNDLYRLYPLYAVNSIFQRP
jgi:DNA-binding PadR family transcriptional regulator